MPEGAGGSPVPAGPVDDRLRRVSFWNRALSEPLRRQSPERSGGSCAPGQEEGETTDGLRAASIRPFSPFLTARWQSPPMMLTGTRQWGAEAASKAMSAPAPLARVRKRTG